MGGTWISRSVPPPDLQGLRVSNWCVSHFPYRLLPDTCIMAGSHIADCIFQVN